MKKLKLNSFIIKRYSPKLIEKYKDKENMLKHARFEKGLTKGYFFIDRKTDELIGYIAIEKNMIVALEVTEKYQGKGYAKKLLNYAIALKANRLTVNRNNENAIDMYKHLGWQRYKSTEKMLWFKYKKPVNK